MLEVTPVKRETKEAVGLLIFKQYAAQHKQGLFVFFFPYWCVSFLLADGSDIDQTHNPF